MTKGLEALESLKQCITKGIFKKYDIVDITSDVAKLFKAIEKELKDLEQYKDFAQDICNYLGLDDLFPYTDLKEIGKQIKSMSDDSHWFVVKQNEKKLKALEIIKRKGIDLFAFIKSENLKEYNKHANNTCSDLTQEEFDTLKEVLL